MNLLRSFVYLVVLSLCLSLPALADPIKPAPWKAGDEVYAFDVGLRNVSGQKDVDLTGTWLHHAADNHRTGITLLYLNNEAAEGYGVGPSYEFLLPKLRYGRVGFGGDASLLGQDLEEAGAIAAATRAFYELYVGDTAAVRFGARWLKVVNEDDPLAADQVNQYGLSIGIALGAPQGVTVN